MRFGFQGYISLFLVLDSEPLGCYKDCFHLQPHFWWSGASSCSNSAGMGKRAYNQCIWEATNRLFGRVLRRLLRLSDIDRQFGENWIASGSFKLFIFQNKVHITQWGKGLRVPLIRLGNVVKSNPHFSCKLSERNIFILLWYFSFFSFVVNARSVTKSFHAWPDSKLLPNQLRQAA